MRHCVTLRGERFAFADLRELLGRASEPKAGDELAGVAARSRRERVAAKLALAGVPLRDLLERPVIDPDSDDVSALIVATHDPVAFAPLDGLTVGGFRDWILAAPPEVLSAVAPGVTPEMAAAVARLMGNLDLIAAASRIRRVTRCRTTLGLPGTLGCRLQPNHPADDPTGILYSAAEGLLFGCGDALIGVNPATDSVETVSAILRTLDRLIDTLAIPTQACCLAHVTTQLAALEAGAPVDLLFQSVAGTQAANASFGVTLGLLQEGRERTLEGHRARFGAEAAAGRQVTYFETGQGSCLSAGAHHGVDQLTLEARAYAVARAFDPFLVNTVVGFIGPEYLADERQITRAGLEDHFMGKLMGLPMGCDVCYTNHADADQNSADNLLMLLASAGCNFVMGVPCADDVMLNYQSTSYHDVATARRVLGLTAAPEFARWLAGFDGRRAFELAGSVVRGSVGA